MNKKSFISLLEKKIDSINPAEGLLMNTVETIIYSYTISLLESGKGEDKVWNEYKPFLFESCDKQLLMHECSLNKDDISQDIKEIEKLLRKEISNTLKYVKKDDSFAAYDSYLKYLEHDVAIAKKQLELLSIISYEEKIDYRTLSEFKELMNYVKVLYFPLC